MQFPALPQLAFSDAAAVHAVTSLAVYFIFKRYEPSTPPKALPFLTTPPLIGVVLFSQHIHWALATLLAYSSFYTTIVLSVLAYRLGPWHPLAKYPGPLSHKASKLVFAFHSFQGNTHRYVYDLHQKYGDVVRIGPNELSIRDAAAIAPIMGTNGLPRGPNWEGRVLFEVKPMVALRDPAEHAARRRPWNRAFNTAALKGYEEIISKRVIQLVDGLANAKQADLARWFGYFTFDFMGDMAFGGGSEMMVEGQDKSGLWHMLETGLKFLTVLGHVPWVTRYLHLLFPKMAQGHRRLTALGIGSAMKRVKNGSQFKDIFYYLNNEDGKAEEQPSFPVAVADGVLAVIAGSDTTSGVLSGLFYSILREPEYYQRLREEVDKYYPAGEDALDTQHHGKMIFLSALINETMRLFPGLPSGSQRSSAHRGAKMFGDYFIPEETQVAINYYSVQRDPRYFHRPHEFIPERWLIANDEEARSKVPGFTHDTTAFVPWSFGPTNCVGKNLALQEMYMAVCLIMQQLDIRLEDGYNPDEYLDTMKEYLVFQRGRLPVVITRREVR